MDTQYLKRNVNEAVIEALTSMVVSCPDDNVEYLGRYLIQYVNRKGAIAGAEISARQAEVEAEKDIEAEKLKANAEQEASDKTKARENKLAIFCETLPNNFTSKNEMMDAVTNFLASYLDVPNAYLAVNKKTEESETLLYFSTNKDNTTMLGQRLPKAGGGDEDDAPQRQGITFDCFIIPEAPEEEAPPEDEENPGPPKPPPTAQPLVVDNCMREKRLKFFGIPKLGSFAAIPLIFDSSDHEGGLQPGPEAAPPAEGEEGADPAEPQAPPPKYVQSFVSLQMALCMDTVGAFRRFSDAEVAVAKRVGDALVTGLTSLEKREFEAHCDYVDAAPANADKFTTEIPAKIAEEDAAAAAAVAEECAALPDASDKEALTAAKTAEAAFSTVDKVIKEGTVLDALDSMSGFMLPPPPVVTFLVYTLAGMLGIEDSASKDVCGDISWGSMRKAVVPQLVRKFAEFSMATESTTLTDDAVKALMEAKGLADAAAYPPTFAFLPIILQWITKALACRDANKAYAAAKAEAEAAAAAAAADAEAAQEGEE